MSREIIVEKTRDWLMGSVKEGNYYVYNDILPDTGEIFYIGSGSVDRVLFKPRTHNKGWIKITNKHKNWIRVISYETDDRELAYEVEEYLIAMNWRSRYLVNTTIYGNRNHLELSLLSKEKHSVPVVCVNTNQEFPSIAQAELETGAKAVCACCRGLIAFSGFGANNEPLKWRYKNNVYYFAHLTNDEVLKRSRLERPVICLNHNLRFSSEAEASRYYGLPNGNLCRTLSGGQLYCGIDEKTNKPLRWKYQDGICHADGYSDEELLSSNKKRSVIWINAGIEFDSIKEAVRQTGFTGVSACCRGIRLYAGIKDGIPQRWKYSDGINHSEGISDEELLFQPKHKKVRCITTNEVFSSLTEGANRYNICPSSLAKHCKGSNGTKYCGKYPITNEKLVWEYINDCKENNNG